VKAKPATATVPSAKTLAAALGRSCAAWEAIVAAMRKTYAPLDVVWQPSAQLAFGRYCRLIRKKRTLLYLIPKVRCFEVVVGLGERATALALKDGLPVSIIRIIEAAKVYPEGRFVRFDVAALATVPVVLRLVAIKATPK
jgi:hypothetical protein